MARSISPEEEETIQSRTLALSLPEILDHIASILVTVAPFSLSSLRLVSRGFELGTRNVFVSKFFGTVSVMYSARGLKRLQDIASSPRLLRKLRLVKLVAPGWWFALLPTKDELERTMVRFFAAKLDVRRNMTEDMKSWNTSARLKRLAKQWAEFVEVHDAMKSWLDAGLDMDDVRKALGALRPVAGNITFRLWVDPVIIFDSDPPFDSPAYCRISYYAPLDSPYESRLTGFDALSSAWPPIACWQTTNLLSERMLHAVITSISSVGVPIRGLLHSEIITGCDNNASELVPSMVDQMIEYVGTTGTPFAAIKTLGFSAAWVKSSNYPDQFPWSAPRFSDPRALVADAQSFNRFLSCAPNLSRLDLKLRCTDTPQHIDPLETTWRAGTFNTALISGLHFPCLRELVLAGTFAGVGVLQQFLMRNNRLTELKLSHIYLDDAQWVGVFEAVDSMQNLQSLEMISLLQDSDRGRMFLTFTEALASVGRNAEDTRFGDLGIGSKFNLSNQDLKIARKYLKDVTVVPMQTTLNRWQEIFS